MATMDDIEVRVLGSLIEKEITTPAYYPMTLNALTNACNQKNNRNPIISIDETTVFRALQSLREKQLVVTVTGDGMRVPKYKHACPAGFGWSREELAVMCVLMLRGAQTAGEIRSRAGAMLTLDGIDLETTLFARLATAMPEPFVRQLPRRAGQKESRYVHLLAGEPVIEPEEGEAMAERATLQVVREDQRIAALEKEVKRLLALLEELRGEFDQFRKQFE